MNSERKTSIFDNSLIWFGAGVSLAEIVTGTYFASLGFSTALLAIVVGHVIGCVLLFLAGLIGAKTGRSAMETAAMSFGKRGAVVFALLNVVQLVGFPQTRCSIAAHGCGVSSLARSLFYGCALALRA